MNTTAERRRTKRYPVTLSAKVIDADRTHRVAVLDIGAGGLLLSGSGCPDPEIGRTLDIDAAVIGRFRARVVGITERGVHLALDEAPPHYNRALGKISRLARIWR